MSNYRCNKLMSNLHIFQIEFHSSMLHSANHCIQFNIHSGAMCERQESTTKRTKNGRHKSTSSTKWIKIWSVHVMCTASTIVAQSISCSQFTLAQYVYAPHSLCNLVFLLTVIRSIFVIKPSNHVNNISPTWNAIQSPLFTCSHPVQQTEAIARASTLE